MLLYGRLHFRPYKNYIIIIDVETNYTEVVLQSYLRQKICIEIYSTVFPRKRMTELYVNVTKEGSEKNAKYSFTEADDKLSTPLNITTVKQLKKACSHSSTSMITIRLHYPIQPFTKPSKLTELKKDIISRCDGLVLKMDYTYKVYDDIEIGGGDICIGLFHKEKYISEILVRPAFMEDIPEEGISKTDRVLEIMSSTHPDYGGRKYNILLRAIAIILGKYIDNSTIVVSYAVNPVSVWIMIKHFDAIPDEHFRDYMKKHKKVTLTMIQGYYANNYVVTCRVPLTKEYVKKAWEVYYAILDKDSSLKCP